MRMGYAESLAGRPPQENEERGAPAPAAPEAEVEAEGLPAAAPSPTSLDAASKALASAGEIHKRVLENLGRAQAVLAQSRNRLAQRVEGIELAQAMLARHRGDVAAAALERRLAGVWQQMAGLGLARVHDEPDVARSYVSSWVGVSDGWAGKVVVECEPVLAQSLAQRVCGPAAGSAEQAEVLGILASAIAGCIARELGAAGVTQPMSAASAAPRDPISTEADAPVIQWRYSSRGEYLIVSLVATDPA